MYRTDKPTAEHILALLSADFCGGNERYAMLDLGTVSFLGVEYKTYFEDFEEVPYSAIVKWKEI